jgi:hypothetical protein
VGFKCKIDFTDLCYFSGTDSIYSDLPNCYYLIIFITFHRAGAAEFPFKRTSTGITDGVQDGSAEQDDQQPAPKKQRTGPEPGIDNY